MTHMVAMYIIQSETFPKAIQTDFGWTLFRRAGLLPQNFTEIISW